MTWDSLVNVVAAHYLNLAAHYLNLDRFWLESLPLSDDQGECVATGWSAILQSEQSRG